MTKSSESVPSGLDPDPDSRFPATRTPLAPPLVSIGRAPVLESCFGELMNPAANKNQKQLKFEKNIEHYVSLEARNLQDEN